MLAQAFYEGKFAGLQVPVVPVTDTRDGGHRGHGARLTPSLDFTTSQMRPAQSSGILKAAETTRGDRGLWYWQYGLLIGYGFALVYAVARQKRAVKPNQAEPKRLVQ